VTTTAPTPETPRPAVDRFGPWVALFAAIGLTASGEFQLAALADFPGWIAWALPTAIDVYVVQAMRRHRDVLAALLLMIGTNACYHLAAARLFGVTKTGAPAWWLIVAISAIAPVIVWRVHRITEERPKAAAEVAGDGVPLDAAERPEIVSGPDHGALVEIPAVARPAVSEPATVLAIEAPPEYATPRHEAPATAATVAPRPDATERPQSAAPKAPRRTLRRNTAAGSRGAATQAIRALYDTLGARPLESQMVAELIRIKSEHTSRQFANKLRAEIEKDHPELAALGSPNVRPLTGTDG
jgi:hypothetical protein